MVLSDVASWIPHIRCHVIFFLSFFFFPLFFPSSISSFLLPQQSVVELGLELEQVGRRQIHHSSAHRSSSASTQRQSTDLLSQQSLRRRGQHDDRNLSRSSLSSPSMYHAASRTGSVSALYLAVVATLGSWSPWSRRFSWMDVALPWLGNSTAGPGSARNALPTLARGWGGLGSRARGRAVAAAGALARGWGGLGSHARTWVAATVARVLAGQWRIGLAR